MNAYHVEGIDPTDTVHTLNVTSSRVKAFRTNRPRGWVVRASEWNDGQIVKEWFYNEKFQRWEEQ